jgi:hypothetical protein
MIYSPVNPLRFMAAPLSERTLTHSGGGSGDHVTLSASFPGREKSRVTPLA